MTEKATCALPLPAFRALSSISGSCLGACRFLPRGRIRKVSPGPPLLCSPQGQLQALCLPAVNKCGFANVCCCLPKTPSPPLCAWSQQPCQVLASRSRGVEWVRVSQCLPGRGHYMKNLKPVLVSRSQLDTLLPSTDRNRDRCTRFLMMAPFI